MSTPRKDLYKGAKDLIDATHIMSGVSKRREVRKSKAKLLTMVIQKAEEVNNATDGNISIDFSVLTKQCL